VNRSALRHLDIATTEASRSSLDDLAGEQPVFTFHLLALNIVNSTFATAHITRIIVGLCEEKVVYTSRTAKQPQLL
jgi:hypothetical protein